MKFLIVNDEKMVAWGGIRALENAGHKVDSIIPTWHGMMTFDGSALSDDQIRTLIRDSDVILLDHEMLSQDGEELLAHWKSQGIDFSGKRIIGTSTQDQLYLTEHFKGFMSYPGSIEGMKALGFC